MQGSMGSCATAASGRCGIDHFVASNLCKFEHWVNRTPPIQIQRAVAKRVRPSAGIRLIGYYEVNSILLSSREILRKPMTFEVMTLP